MFLTLLFILGFQTETSLSDIPTDDRGIIMNPYEITQPEHDFWIFEICQRIQKAFRENPETNTFPGVQVSGSKVIVDPNIQTDMVTLTNGMLILREYLGLTKKDSKMRNYNRGKLLERGMSDIAITQFFHDLSSPEMEVNTFINDQFRSKKITIWYGTLQKVEAIQASDMPTMKKISKKNQLIGHAVDQVWEASFDIERSYADAILNLLPKEREQKVIGTYTLEIMSHFDKVSYEVGYKDGDIAAHLTWLINEKTKIKQHAKENNLPNAEVIK